MFKVFFALIQLKAKHTFSNPSLVRLIQPHINNHLPSVLADIFMKPQVCPWCLRYDETRMLDHELGVYLILYKSQNLLK